jgi:hypothetical protein
MVLTIFLNVLIDNTSIDPARLRDELMDLIRRSEPLPQNTTTIDYFSQLDRIDRLVIPIRKFFSSKKTFHGMRVYVNGNLINYF